MIRFVFRFLGLWFLAAAFFFFVYDGGKSFVDRTVYFTKIIDLWSYVHQASLLAIQPWIQRELPWFWNPGFLSILTSPAFLGLGLVGALLTLMGRKKKPLIGYSRS